MEKPSTQNGMTLIFRKEYGLFVINLSAHQEMVWDGHLNGEKSVHIKLLPEAINFLKQLSKRPDVYGQVGIGKNAYWKKQTLYSRFRKNHDRRSIQEKYVGVRDFRTAWNNLRCKAGLPDLQVKDLRTFLIGYLGPKSDLSNRS